MKQISRNIKSSASVRRCLEGFANAGETRKQFQHTSEIVRNNLEHIIMSKSTSSIWNYRGQGTASFVSRGSMLPLDVMSYSGYICIELVN